MYVAVYHKEAAMVKSRAVYVSPLLVSRTKRRAGIAARISFSDLETPKNRRVGRGCKIETHMFSGVYSGRASSL